MLVRKLARASGRKLRRNRGRIKTLTVGDLSLVLARLASLTTRNEALVRRLRSPLNAHLFIVGYFTHACVLTRFTIPDKKYWTTRSLVIKRKLQQARVYYKHHFPSKQCKFMFYIYLNKEPTFVSNNANVFLIS